jgi:hypothetical protein
MRGDFVKQSPVSRMIRNPAPVSSRARRSGQRSIGGTQTGSIGGGPLAGVDYFGKRIDLCGPECNPCRDSVKSQRRFFGRIALGTVYCLSSLPG